MKTLDEQIDDIEKLDALRNKARTLRQEAIEALTAGPYKPRPRDLPGTTLNKKALAEWEGKAGRPGWDLPGDDVEKAEMLRALASHEPKREESKKNQKESRQELIKDLISIKLADLDDSASDSSGERLLDSVPVFRCAMILQALAETPGQAFSEAALFCFDRIVQELNEVTAPDWMEGAARASKRSQATAFVTGECARALLALETVLRHTAAAAKLFGKEAARQSLASATGLDKVEVWRTSEEKFRKHSIEVSLNSLPYGIIAKFDLEESAFKSLNRIVAELNRISTAFGRPETPQAPVERLANALHIDPKIALESDLEKKGEKIAEQVDVAALIIHDYLRPMEKFAESVINREIASSHQKDLVDGAELVFAATLLGSASDWKRPKIQAAFTVLYPLLSTDGRLLSIRPFDVHEKGYRLNAATLGVARHMAELIANLDAEPEPEFVERLMLPFESTRVPAAKKSGSGWTTDPQPREPKSLWWLTAIALDALDAIVRMLDEAINRRVLRNFQVRQPESLDRKLDDLFYPDHGLAAAYDRESVAFRLQQLREHACRGPANKDPLYILTKQASPAA